VLFERSAGAVIFRRRNTKVEYLLLHYPSGHWDFVKGNIERGEDELETLRREAFEEAGIKDLRIINGFRERIEYYYRREKTLVHKEVVFHLAETKQSEVRLSEEHLDAKWLTYRDAVEKLTYSNAKNLLRKANKLIEEKLGDQPG